MRVLIWGGANFLGRYLVACLADCGEEKIAVVDQKSEAVWRVLTCDLPPRLADYDRVTGSGSGRLSRLLAGTDAVVELGCQWLCAHGILRPGAVVPRVMATTNRLLAAMARAGVARYVRVSCSAVYGEGGSKDRGVDPRHPCAAAQAGADLLALSHHYGPCSVSVVRVAEPYGRHQHPGTLPLRLVRRAIQGEPLRIRAGRRHRFTHAEDVARGILLALLRGRRGEIYDLAGSEEIDEVDLARRILELTGGSDCELTGYLASGAYPSSLPKDIQRSELGWAPRISLQAGLNDLISWYTENS